MKPETAGMIICGLFILIAVVATVVDFEARKPKKNIRVPRQTLWERTNRYHGDRS